MTDELSLREQLVAHYKQVAALGLNEGSSGNLSARFADGMLISPNGAKAESLAAADVVETAFDGTYTGGRLPSSEWRMHAAIYQRYPETRAVVHTHSDYCVAVASHQIALPGFHYLVGVFGGDDVPCVPYSTFGRQKLADDAADALAERTACLLGNHGMIAHGPSLPARREPGASPGDHVSAVRARPTARRTQAADRRRLGGLPQEGAGDGVREERLTGSRPLSRPFEEK